MLQEVTIASNIMKVDKAPHLDGFTINFFHACWDMLKLEVLDLVEESWVAHIITHALNATFLTLVPK